MGEESKDLITLHFILFTIAVVGVVLSCALSIRAARYKTNDVQRYGEYVVAGRDFALAMVVFALLLNGWYG